MSIIDRLKSHSVLLIVFTLVVLGVIVWKLTAPAVWMGEEFLDADLAEIRAQVLASAFKKQSPGQQTNNSNCPLRADTGSSGVAPCFLGLKDKDNILSWNGNSLKPLPELAPVAHRQFPKCLRCEDVINRAISITPANGSFSLGHFLAKKKDNNSVVIIPEIINNSAVRRATDGNFRLILGLSDPLHGISIYYPESDCVIARDAAGRVALAPINDFAGALAPAATFELVDGPDNYSTVAFKCIPINGEYPNKYLGFAAGATPGGMPLMVLLSNSGKLPVGATYEFDLVDIETSIPVIMNKHSGLECQIAVINTAVDATVEGFISGDVNDTDANLDTRDKRIVHGMVIEGELGNSDIQKQETNGIVHKIITGYQQEMEGMNHANLDVLLGGLPPLAKQNIHVMRNNIDTLLSTITNEYATEKFANMSTATNNNFAVGMLPITLEELGKVPDNLFKPAAGIAFNNALNVQNQVYKDKLTDKVFQKLNAAKLSPSVQNILDYNTTAHKVYQDENHNFAENINAQNRSNSDRLDNVIAELDNQRVIGMSKDLFFMRNQLEKANATPAPRN